LKSFSYELALGSNHFVIKSTDSYGNVTQKVFENLTYLPPNQLPFAQFSTSAAPFVAGQSISFNALTSSDPDGTIVNAQWNFGDQTSGSGLLTSHIYAAGGTYTVNLTVTDNRGGSASASLELIVVEPPKIITDFQDHSVVKTNNMSVKIQSSTTTTTEIKIGGETALITPSQDFIFYLQEGLNQFVVQTTDSNGIVATKSFEDLSLIFDNILPVANFTFSPQNAIAPGTVTFNGTTSFDPDLDAIVDYRWSFADGTFGTGAVVSHNYQQAGEYLTSLTVTDARGGKHTVQQWVSVKANQPPRADFLAETHTDTGVLRLNLNAAASEDVDGSITGYLWSFGDGSTSTEQNPEHIYSGPNTYSVSLTVTDDRGAQTTESRFIEVRDQTGPVIAITSPADGTEIQPGAITISGTSNEALERVTLKLGDDPEVISRAFNEDFSFIVGIETILRGPQVLVVRGFDLAGNMTEITVHLNLSTNLPPVASLNVLSPTSGAVPFIGLFDASASSDPEGGPLTYTWDFGDGVMVAGGSTISHAFAEIRDYQVRVFVRDAAGAESIKSVQITGQQVQVASLPPASVMSAVSEVEDVPLHERTAFLYSGASPTQVGMQPGALNPKRYAVVHGKVLDQNGNPLAGATIGTLFDDGMGTTQSRTDGEFDLAVNGGGPVVLTIDRAGYGQVQRTIQVPWQDSVQAPEIRMVRQSTVDNTILLNHSLAQVIEGPTSSDANGPRTPVIIVPPQTNVTIPTASGDLLLKDRFSFRLSELSVGDNGPEKMPGTLPASSAYTYSVRLAAMEAIAMGTTAQAVLSKPFSLYLDNFLNIPVGRGLPTAFYAARLGQWVPLRDGVVLKILAKSGDLAVIDVTGTGTAATSMALTNLGITNEELRILAQRFDVGKTLW
jgi:PKD repeat protein